LENGGDCLGEDVLVVIRALRLNKLVLVEHSIAGAELSSAATLQPNSIVGVAYLEAAYPYAFDKETGPQPSTPSLARV
jgi:non-heme chloroperoxidase